MSTFESREAQGIRDNNQHLMPATSYKIEVYLPYFVKRGSEKIMTNNRYRCSELYIFVKLRRKNNLTKSMEI